MGYLLSELGHLPCEPDVDLYILVINGAWSGGRFEILARNFEEIARQIGPKAVIAKGFQASVWNAELCRRYLGRDYKSFLPLLPALLVTDAHPKRLREDSLRLLVPLKRAEKRAGDLETFFRLLADFAVRRDPEFLRRFAEPNLTAERALDILDLKPGVFGIGININALLRRLQHPWLREDEMI